MQDKLSLHHYPLSPIYPSKHHVSFTGLASAPVSDSADNITLPISPICRKWKETAAHNQKGFFFFFFGGGVCVGDNFVAGWPFLSPCGLWGWNSDPQAWWQATLAAEPSG